MTSNPAPNGGAGHGDRDRFGPGSSGADRPIGRAEDGARARVPAADGVAPARSEVDRIDWSGGPREAALGRLLDRCASIDQLRREQVEALIRVVEEGAAETVLGVPLEVVLSQTGRATAFETRRLLRAARVLARMPAVRQVFVQGCLSWPQVDAICHHTHRLPVGRWDDIDRIVADRAVAAADAEADAIVEEVEWAAAKIREQRRSERKKTRVECDQLRLGPRADASGELHAEYGPDRFPLIEAAIDHAARELLRDLPDPDDLPEDAPHAAVTEAHRHAARLKGRNAGARAAALFELVTGRDYDTLAPLAADRGRSDPDAGESASDRGRCRDSDSGGSCGCVHAGGGTTAAGSPARRCDGGCGGRGVVDRPGMVLTAPLDSLLDGSVPARVVSRLTARMQVTAAAARRIADAGHADVRLVVMDGGRPVGVGRATSVPPGWLRDAIVATHPTDTAPCSNTPAVLCDMEHAVPFDDGGQTDVANVAPVSRRWHSRKTAGDIDLHRHADGRATWTATATGYTVVTWPAPHLDDETRGDRLTSDALRRLQDVPHPADMTITCEPADHACTVRDADGRVLHAGRAPP